MMILLDFFPLTNEKYSLCLHDKMNKFQVANSFPFKAKKLGCYMKVKC